MRVAQAARTGAAVGGCGRVQRAAEHDGAQTDLGAQTRWREISPTAPSSLFTNTKLNTLEFVLKPITTGDPSLLFSLAVHTSSDGRAGLSHRSDCRTDCHQRRFVACIPLPLPLLSLLPPQPHLQRRPRGARRAAERFAPPARACSPDHRRCVRLLSSCSLIEVPALTSTSPPPLLPRSAGNTTRPSSRAGRAT